MSDIPRKLLIVEQEPPKEGFVCMMEWHNRTYSMQLSNREGLELMSRIQSAILDYGVQRGIVKPLMPEVTIRKRRRK